MNHDIKKILPVIVVTYGSLFTLGLIDNLRGPLFPSILSHFNINSQTGSLLFTPSSLAALITSLLSPWWLSLIGPKKSLYLSLGFMGIGTLFFGLASLLGSSFWPMVAGSITFGIGNGFCSICINILLGQVAPVTHLRQLFSGMHAMYGLASLFAPLVATFFGPKLWPYAFLLSVAPALIFLIIAFSAFEEQTSKPVFQQTPKNTLPFFIGLLYPGSMLAFYVCAEVLLATRLSQYLEHALNWSYHRATTYNFYFFMGLTLGRILTAFLPIRWNTRKMLFISLITSIIAFTLGFRYPATLVITGLTMSYFFPLTMVAVTEHFKQDAPAYIAKSLILVGIFLTGMHYLVGTMTDYWGIQAALLLGPIFLVLSLLILFKNRGANQTVVDTSSR